MRDCLNNFILGDCKSIKTHFPSNIITHGERNMDLVIDIGGNIGYFPLVEIMSDAPNVIAIEPLPFSTKSYYIRLGNIYK
jgi:hypothetical protein